MASNACLDVKGATFESFTKVSSQDAYCFPHKRYILVNSYIFFNGFDEEMETSYSSMPTNCNVNSSAMPNSTQDSVSGSEIEVDGRIPPITFKRKLDDSVDASL